MDESVDPCANFYKFACGNFEKNVVLPADKTAITALILLSDTVDEQVSKIIAEPITPNEPKFSRLVKYLYQSCINTNAIENDGLDTLAREIKKLGGWPVLDGDSWNETTFDFMETAYRLRQNGYFDNFFWDMTPFIDKKNSSQRRLYIDQPPFGLKREYFTRPKGLKEPEVLAYRQYQIDVATLLGADPIRSEKEMTDAVEFERKLANLSLSTEDRQNLTRLYNPMTVRDLQNRWKSIPWLEYINKILPESVSVNENEMVIVQAPEYFDGFEAVIQETDKRTQANYAMWKAIRSSVSYLSDKIRKIQLKYITVLSGLEEREPRWKECTYNANKFLSFAVGAVYIRHYFDEESKKSVVEMVEDIRSALIQTLSEVDWMDPITKKRATEKATKMYTHIGYAAELLNDTILEKYYEGLEVNNQDYFLNILNLTKFLGDETYKLLRESVNLTDWRRHGKPAEVNAFYAPYENSAEFPSAILQGIFYNSYRPKYLNYGAMGLVMGHELIHGFDNRGSQYDIDGNWNNWWEPKTNEKFLEKTKCIINQYGKYNVSEIGLLLNGNVSQGENIADNGGLKLAYRAYQTWIQRNTQEPTIPGLQKYSPNQLFWISSANIWCNVIRKETLKYSVLTGSHPPGEFRVNGAVSNLPAFGKDFNCSVGANMNPEQKCSVW